MTGIEIADIPGTPRPDPFDSTEDADGITGLNGNDTITAFDDNDMGNGFDLLSSGGGTDSPYGGNDGDRLILDRCLAAR